MPMVVFVVGTMFGTERFTLKTSLNMVVVGTGIAIASYGEGSLMLGHLCSWACAVVHVAASYLP